MIDLGVSQEQIVSEIDIFIHREELDIIEWREEQKAEPKLIIGFLPGGVMGDNIISLRLYQEFVKLAPDCLIDVITTFNGFPEHVFYGQKNLRRIVHKVIDASDRNEYDVLIQSHFEPSLIYCNMARVEKLAPKMAECLKILYKYQKTDWFMCSPSQYMNRLQWDRAAFKGYTCYTILGSSGAFDITDYKVDFPLNEEYEKRGLESTLKASG